LKRVCQAGDFLGVRGRVQIPFGKEFPRVPGRAGDNFPDLSLDQALLFT